MDDFEKMLEIVNRVETQVDDLRDDFSDMRKELALQIESISKFRWRVEGMFFVIGGIVSGAVAFAVELLR
jgi:hypothetical protein